MILFFQSLQITSVYTITRFSTVSHHFSRDTVVYTRQKCVSCIAVFQALALRLQHEESVRAKAAHEKENANLLHALQHQAREHQEKARQEERERQATAAAQAAAIAAPAPVIPALSPEELQRFIVQLPPGLLTVLQLAQLQEMAAAQQQQQAAIVLRATVAAGGGAPETTRAMLAAIDAQMATNNQQLQQNQLATALLNHQITVNVSRFIQVPRFEGFRGSVVRIAQIRLATCSQQNQTRLDSNPQIRYLNDIFL